MERQRARRSDAVRLQAAEAGSTTYTGARCWRCRGTLRYVSCAKCVRCAKAQAIRRQRDQRMTYDDHPRLGCICRGAPCVRCGGVSRYARSGRCVACRRREAQEPPQLAPGSTN